MTGGIDALIHKLRGVRQRCALAQIGSDRDLLFTLRIDLSRLARAIDVQPDPALFGAAPDPGLIDDLPVSVRVGIRRHERKR
jgi:hypothetical protein